MLRRAGSTGYTLPLFTELKRKLAYEEQIASATACSIDLRSVLITRCPAVFGRDAVDEAYSCLDRLIAIRAVRRAAASIILVDTITFLVPGRCYARIQMEALDLLLGHELSVPLVSLLGHQTSPITIDVTSTGTATQKRA